MNSNSQSGAVFIYILLAIALLAALTYAVIQSNRANTTTLTKDQARLAAQEIIDYGNTIANAVNKLRLRGCSDTEVSFENSIGPVNYTNPNAPTNKSCHVFDQNGGGVQYQLTNVDFLVDNYAFQDPRFTSGYQHENVGSIENELTFKVTWLRQEICIAMNELLGITNPGGKPPVENNDSASNVFQGTYGTTVTDTIGDDGTGLDGKLSFCRYTSASDTYQFNQVLIAR